MFKFDFSQTKDDWLAMKAEVKTGVAGEWKKTAKEKLKRFLQPLFDRLGIKQTIFWLIFLSVSFSSTITILYFIDSFLEEQDRYQSALTSVGRNRAEYRELNTIATTTTKDLTEPL